MTQVDIERIAAGGSGVGRLPSGKTVFVPRTAPGDRVQVDVEQEKARWASGRPVAFDIRGPDRVEAPCVHYERDSCGGCQLQHLRYPTQCSVKSTLIGEALRRIGKRDVRDPPVTPAPNQWRYRSKITLAADRALGRIGLHRWDAPGTLIEPEDCPITDEAVMGLWKRLRTMPDLLPGDLAQLILRLDRDRRLHVLVVSADPWNAGRLAEALADPNLSIWWKPTGGAARVLAGPEAGFPATAFEQSSQDLAREIRRRVLAFLAPSTGDVIWDLYGGLGDTARLLAAAGAAVWSVDSDRRAHDWARRRPHPPEAGPVEFVTGRAEDVLDGLPRSPAGVVLNPPRAGAVARVVERLDRLAASGTRRVAYISCDPPTLARDLQRLPAWQIVDLEGFDLFPQTSHVETLVLLEAGA